MKVQSVELIHLDVPFTDHTNQHMQYWLPHWRIVQLCKITLARRHHRLGRNYSQLHVG